MTAPALAPSPRATGTVTQAPTEPEALGRPWTRRRGRPSWLTAEVGNLSLLLLVAAIIRVPYLWELPRLTDESNEAFRALQIVYRDARPLTNVDPYIGPLWNYLLAFVFWLTGSILYAPRAVVAVLGTLTVVPTYLLGRSFGGRWTGLIAASFLALSPTHVAVNSHIAWSNCVTPLFTTAALWLTHRAVVADRPSALIWAGIAWGLALLTHPTAALFLPAIGLYVVIARPRWLRTRWLWLAAGAGLLACSPLVWANLQGGFVGLSAGLRVQSQYSGGAELDLSMYGRRLYAAFALVSDSLGGALTETGPLRGPFGFSTGLAFCILLALGFWLAARQRLWLPLLAFVFFLVLLPVVNARYAASVPKARYIAPLLPICYAVIGLYLTNLYRQIGTPAVSHPTSNPTGWMSAVSTRIGHPLAIRALLVLAVVGCFVTPLWGLRTYYLQASQEGQTNVWFYRMVSTIDGAVKPGESVHADRALGKVFTSSSGIMLDHLRFVGSANEWRVRVVDLPKGPDDPTPQIRGLLVVANVSAPAAAAAWRLRELDGMPPNAPVRVYRVLGARPPATASNPSVLETMP